jgi:outer membrane biosynthesis protein TonB
MRTLLVIAATLLISQYALAQPAAGRGRGGGRGPAAEPPPPPDPGFECFEHAETPEFPQSALQSHVDGTVYVRVLVTAQGGADKVDTQVASAWGEGQKLLTPAVEKAVRASKFKTQCAGKTVAVVYRYQLLGEATANPKPTTRTELNIMFIESQPQSKPATKSAVPAK